MDGVEWTGVNGVGAVLQPPQPRPAHRWQNRSIIPLRQPSTTKKANGLPRRRFGGLSQCRSDTPPLAPR